MLMNTGNGDRSIPEGDGKKKNNSSDGNKSNDTASNKSERTSLDWREFRANLFAREQVIYFSLSVAVIFLKLNGTICKVPNVSCISLNVMYNIKVLR